MEKCPRCGIEVTALQPVDESLSQKLTDLGEHAPTEVCVACLSELRKIATTAPSGSVLMQQMRAEDQRRQNLWKKRVHMIKKARHQMASKSYADAAVSYEKYLKILEIVFGCKNGEFLTPANFKDNARTSELTVVASVYWDLLRIYDSHDRYAERQAIAARQLATFVRFTPVFPDIMRKAEVFVKSSRNPAIVKSFLKGAAEQRPRCFIATAAFESPLAPEVQILRHFRDWSLRPYAAGRGFIAVYEAISPRLASFLDRHPRFKPACRAVLRFAIRRMS